MFVQALVAELATEIFYVAVLHRWAFALEQHMQASIRGPRRQVFVAGVGSPAFSFVGQLARSLCRNRLFSSLRGPGLRAYRSVLRHIGISLQALRWGLSPASVMDSFTASRRACRPLPNLPPAPSTPDDLLFREVALPHFSSPLSLGRPV